MILSNEQILAHALSDGYTDYLPASFAAGKIKLLGSGVSFPGQPVTNHILFASLEKQVGALAARKAKLISRRLGVEQRYLARNLEQAITIASPSAPELGNLAITHALEDAGLALPQLGQARLGYLIGHTTSPHTLLPPNISWVAQQLKHSGPFMELRQACTGFASALQIAAPMLTSNPDSLPIAIMGSEVGSVYFDLQSGFIDQQQLVNYVQMGDGAGAVILGADDGSGQQIISDMYVGQIGNLRQPGFHLQGGGAGKIKTEAGFPYFLHQVHKVQEQGRDLFIMGLKAMASRGYHLSDFAYILPHQVNGYLPKLFHKLTGLAPEKIVCDATEYGNTGSAAIWLSLDKLRKSGKLQRGDKVLVLGAEATKYMYGGFVYQH